MQVHKEDGGLIYQNQPLDPHAANLIGLNQPNGMVEASYCDPRSRMFHHVQATCSHFLIFRSAERRDPLGYMSRALQGLSPSLSDGAVLELIKLPGIVTLGTHLLYFVCPNSLACIALPCRQQQCSFCEWPWYVTQEIVILAAKGHEAWTISMVDRDLDRVNARCPVQIGADLEIIITSE